LDALAGPGETGRTPDDDEAGAAALLGLERLVEDDEDGDDADDIGFGGNTQDIGESSSSALLSLRQDVLGARREAREAAALAERHSSALGED